MTFDLKVEPYLLIKTGRMTKFPLVSRMPKAEKQRRKKKGGKDNDSDSDGSIDEHGNVRNLIDYGSDSEEEFIPYWAPSAYPPYAYPSHAYPPYMMVSTHRPVRRAAIVARRKIRKMVKDQRLRELRVAPWPVSYRRRTRIISDSSESEVEEEDEDLTSKDEEENMEDNVGNNDNVDEDDDLEDEEDEDDSEDEDDDLEDEEDLDDSEDEDDDLEDEEDLDDSEDEDDDLEDEEDLYEDEEDEEVEEEDKEDEEDGGPSHRMTLPTSKGKAAIGNILFTLLSGQDSERTAPTKYTLKKEPAIVQKFVKLLAEPTEENPMDAQIQQFKTLTDTKQRELVTALENRPAMADTGIQLMLKILTLHVSPEVRAMIFSKYHSLQSMDSSTNEYYKLRAWLEKVVSVPFGQFRELPVRLEDGSDRCGDFMRQARACLDQATYGQDEPKLQIMQFISTKIANPGGRGLSLLLVGPPGIGKTTIIKNGIAKALGWPFQFISLGGDSDASTYTGHQLVYESSHCGKIVNSLVSSKSMSTVLLFDEIDKVSQTARGEEIMNLLVHLTDPVQNSEFEDKYLAGVPIDLSKVMFVFSANDISKIDRVLLDRMIVIELKGYDLKEKTTIAEQYLVPEALREVNLTEKVSISKDILTSIIQEYASEEKGVRELKRCIDQIVQKLNMLRMYNAPELPFHIPGFSLPFIVKKEHIPLFLKKKGAKDAPPFGMYL